LAQSQSALQGNLAPEQNYRRMDPFLEWLPSGVFISYGWDDPDVWGGFCRFVLAVGLSGMAGIRATIPLFLMSLLHVTTGMPLTSELTWIGSPASCFLLGMFLLVEVVADLIPTVDHALHAATIWISPILGAVVAITPQIHGGVLEAAPFAVVGAGTAFLAHSGKAMFRVQSTATTASTCNPVISVAETFGVSVTTVLIMFSTFVSFLVGLLVLFLAYKGGVYVRERYLMRRARIVGADHPFRAATVDLGTIDAAPQQPVPKRSATSRV